MIAANSASSLSLYDVRISALVKGSTAGTARHTCVPQPSGSRASSKATSGRALGAVSDSTNNELVEGYYDADRHVEHCRS